MGSQPHKHEEGSHGPKLKELRVGQEADQETVWGAAQPRYMRDGNYRKAWPAGGRERVGVRARLLAAKRQMQRQKV